MTARSIKARPFQWLWDQGKRLYRKIRGERTEQVVRPAPERRDRLTNQMLERDEVAGLTGRLYAREISIQTWVVDFRRELKAHFRNEYLLARGGREAMMQADWGRLGAMLKKQYQFLDRFAADVEAGKLTEGQARVRASMYFKAATQAYERAREVSHGLPQRLPAIPGDGQTVCKANCQCHWEFEETEDEWLCTWTLGAAEHCLDCIANAGRWNPLAMRKVMT